MISNVRSIKILLFMMACSAPFLLMGNFKDVHKIVPWSIITQTQSMTIAFLNSNRNYGSVHTISTFVSNSTPSEAFVTFCNNKASYLSLLKHVVNAVHLFSTRPIIIYGIDVDVNISNITYPRIIKRRVRQSDCGPSIFFCKIYVILHSRVDYGVYLEADTIVNWNVDILFDLLHRWPYPLPLAPRHPDDPRNYGRFLKQVNLTFSSRTTPYIHAHILWNHLAYPFFHRAVSLMRKLYFMGANFDETGINVLLWEAKANHTLCTIDPYFTALSIYETNQTSCKKSCHFAFIYIHGAKNANTMYNIVERLKNRTGSPFVHTPNDGLHYLNETKYTCCYPDSHRSPIHPLLCEHRQK